MKSVRLYLVIDRPSDPVPSSTTLCNVHVFDKPSHDAVDVAIRRGVFGHHSKSAYRLRGTVNSFTEDDILQVEVDFPFYRKIAAKRPYHVRDVPSCVDFIL